MEKNWNKPLCKEPTSCLRALWKKKSVPELQPPGTEADPPLPQPCYLWYFPGLDTGGYEESGYDRTRSLFDYDGKECYRRCLSVLKNADFKLAESNEIYRTGVIGQFNLTFETCMESYRKY